MREKVVKSRNTVFFQWFVAPEGRKSRLAKAAGAEPAGQMSDEKLHAVVARSRFPSQNVQTHTRVGPLLEVEMSKKCTPLWREAHFQVEMYKTPQRRTTFGSWDVKKVHAVVARSTFRSENVQNTPRSDHFWKLRCRKSARRCGAKHISKSKCIKHTNLGPLLEVQMSLRFASLHYIKLHYTPLHYTTLHYTTLHYTTLHYTTLRYLPLHFTTLHYTTLHYNYNFNYNYTTTLDYTTLHYTTLHSTTLHYITLHYTPQHYNYNYTTTPHNTTTTTTQLHPTTLHYTPLH